MRDNLYWWSRIFESKNFQFLKLNALLLFSHIVSVMYFAQSLCKIIIRRRKKWRQKITQKTFLYGEMHIHSEKKKTKQRKEQISKDFSLLTNWKLVVHIDEHQKPLHIDIYNMIPTQYMVFISFVISAHLFVASRTISCPLFILVVTKH